MINDTCRDCYLYRGFCYKNLKKYDEALADFDKLVYLYPTSGLGYANKASIFYLRNQFYAALENYTAAYRLDSVDILLNPICHMLFANGNRDSACHLYQQLSAKGDTTFNDSIKVYCNKRNYR